MRERKETVIIALSFIRRDAIFVQNINSKGFVHHFVVALFLYFFLFSLDWSLSALYDLLKNQLPRLLLAGPSVC